VDRYSLTLRLRTRRLLLPAIAATLSTCTTHTLPDAEARLAALTCSVGMLNGDTARVGTVLDNYFT